MSRKLEKGTVVIMTTTSFLRKVRRARVPMRKATMDAFLLGTLIVVIFAYSGSIVLFTFPLLLILVLLLVTV